MISKALKKRNIINNVYVKAKDYVELGECSITNLNKLIIVIDNIDRCHNEMAYQLLTDIKTFLSDEKLNVVFVVPVDDEALKRNLFSKNDCNNEKEEFLRKFFNVTLRIKPHQIAELNSYARELNNRNELGFNADTLALCSKEFATNPRRIIQLFNNLSSELCQYSSEFIEKNESAVCAILILKEEYPDYYKNILDDPYLFKNCKIENNEKDEKVKSFIRFVGPIAKRIAIKDLLKILTNSDAIFNAIPEEVRKFIDSYDADGTIKYINLKQELKDDIFAYIRRNVEDDIKSNSETQIINSLEFTSTLSVKLEIEQVFLKEIDLLYQPYYVNLLKQIDKDKLVNICSFALMLDNNGFKNLKEHIMQYVTNIGKENEDIDEYFSKAVFTVFNTDDDSKLLSKFATKLFNKIDIYTDIQYSDCQFNYLFSEELVQAHIAVITIGNNKETEKLLWLFKHKKNIKEESYSLFFNKIKELVGTTTNKEKSNILVYIKYVVKFLCLVENERIKKFDKLEALNQNLAVRKISYNNVYIIDEYKGDAENLHLIIDYFMHIYRISNGVITANQANRICLHDKEYAYSKLIDLLQQGYELKPFYNVIMDDNDYSLSFLIQLTEHCLLLKDDKDQSVIDTTTIKNKLSSLLDNIKNAEVQKLIELLIVDDSFKEWVTENIINRKAQYINELPISLLNLAINSFSEETVSLYENNMDFLAVIASKGSVDQKNELVKILTENVNKKKYINETFNIFETIELEKDYNKRMISSVLQSYKAGNKATDGRIDKLIEKFDIDSL